MWAGLLGETSCTNTAAFGVLALPCCGAGISGWKDAWMCHLDQCGCSAVHASGLLTRPVVQAGTLPRDRPDRPPAALELCSRVLLWIKKRPGGGGLGWRPGPTAGRAALGQSLDLPRVRVQSRSVEGPPVVVSSGTVGAGLGPVRAGLSAGGRAGSLLRRTEAWGPASQSREVGGHGSRMATWRLPVSISPASRQTKTG